MKLRVAEHVPLPHSVLIPNPDTNAVERMVTVSFTPDAEVPDDWGTRRLGEKHGIFIPAVGEPDMSKYRVMEISLVQALHEKFDALNEDEKGKTLKYMEKLVEDRKAAIASKAAKEEDAKRREIRETAEKHAKAKKEGKE